jgi:glycosyltransferase involved in cell wall biosynthesis
VLPSLEEGMSYPLLRAMATGVPVVATDIPGNRLLVEHEHHGLLAPVDDAAALVEAVERLFDNPHLAAAVGAAARTRVAEEFALATTVDGHLRLFDSLVHSRLDAAPL